MSFRTEQEAFWAGSFGNEYIDRNRSDEYLASNLAFFSKALKQTGKIGSLIEFGSNIGMNLRAIQLLFPKIELWGIEINQEAARQLGKVIGDDHVLNSSILDYQSNQLFDVSLIKGVLIHINPQMLPVVYENLHRASRKYILICEYYNPTPIAIEYRGHTERLFKRDFAGEMLDQYEDLSLLDYGFSYRRDPSFPQGDITWFLLAKS
ncbi:MAG: pseudaminic acid biosynthesis-associated methylase [Saprospiraceae bacterium]|nr:pseudaminic acid biosynthesis-associated methylase [Saprospiraceae bacterium]